jgi:hypothetical protein
MGLRVDCPSARGGTTLRQIRVRVVDYAVSLFRVVVYAEGEGTSSVHRERRSFFRA